MATFNYTFPSVTFGNLTFTAKRWGQFPTVSLTAGGTAGAEVVTVTGTSNVDVKIASGVSTNLQIQTAIANSFASSGFSAQDLVSVSFTGGHGSDTQTTQSATAMSGAAAQAASQPSSDPKAQLPDAKLWVGDVDGVPQAVVMSGDATMDDTGHVTVIGDSGIVVTPHKVVVSDAAGHLTTSPTSDTEVGYVQGVTSAIQTQLNGKQASLGYTPVNKAGDTMSGDLNMGGNHIRAAASIENDSGHEAISFDTGDHIVEIIANSETVVDVDGPNHQLRVRQADAIVWGRLGETQDSGIDRVGAGVLEVTNSTPGTLANLRVATPTNANDAATKSYVDAGGNVNWTAYRRPNLIYQAVGVGEVVPELGLVDGVAGHATILFPDGSLRTEANAGLYTCLFSQNAVFTNATLLNNQGGIRSGSVVVNSWYAVYAVKVTTFAADFVLVADTVLPLRANFATLNANFGTNSWVYLGLTRYDAGTGDTSGLLPFTQNGNFTAFTNANGVNTAQTLPGLMLATSASTSALVWTYAAGTSGAVLPDNIAMAMFTFAGNKFTEATNSAESIVFIQTGTGTTLQAFEAIKPATMGIAVINGSANKADINVSGFWDAALGVGSNPLL